MEVQLVCVTGMPNGVLVWVDRDGPETVVYVDKSLYEGDKLTRDGMIRVSRATSEQCALADLRRARPMLYAVAG